MPENHYDTLGVPKNASQDDIKRAYRKIAVKYHPDKKPDNKIAEEIYREATEAYEILKDPEKRKKYDSLFTWSRPKKILKRNIRGSDLRINLKVNRADLIYRAERIIAIERKGKCKSCDGTGSLDRKTKKCTYCNGTGLQGFSLAIGEKKKCLYCKGIGITREGMRCFDCRGTAIAPEIVRRKIILHPLMSAPIVLLETGNHCFGGTPGDLFIDLDIIEDPNYSVNNLDVTGKIKISPAQAILGDTVNLAVFGKSITIRIPPGIKNGNTIEKNKAGITYEGKTGRFKAIIYINIPTIITDQEKELYQKLLKIEKETPWPKTMSF